MLHRASFIPRLDCGIVILLLLAAGCSEPLPLTPPPVGVLHLSVTTTGGDPDRDGYRLAVDGVAADSVGASATAVFTGLPPGIHTVELRNVAANCTVAGDNPQSVTVLRGDTAQVAFAVLCVATGVQVIIATTGIDADADGYAVAVDTGPPVPIGVNGTATVTYLSAGPHTVTLSGLAANCTAGQPNPRSVSLTSGQVAVESFAVTCVATTGVLEVTAATGGIDLDANGYTVQVDGGTAQPLAANGAATFPGLSPGSHSVSVAGAAGNCTIGGSNPRTVSITAGGTARDTARTSFAVGCVASTGVLEITVATSGIELDANGYTVQVDGGTALSLAVNGAATFPGLSPGSHSVSVAGAAGNCTIGGTNPRTVSVTAGGTTRDTTRTTFAITCVATTGAIQVTVATSGIDLDANGYTIQVDAGTALPLAVNGAATFPGLSPGSHSVNVAGAAGNCTIGGTNPRTVSVTAGGTTRDTTRTTFAITCVATTGAIQVTVATSGGDLDSNGYTARVVDLSLSSGVGTSGTVTMTGVPVGDHSVGLGDAAGNCTVAGPNPRTVTVTAGATTRDTVRTSFTVSCVAFTGAVRATIATTGVDPDSNGYSVRLLGTSFDRTTSVTTNGTALITRMPAGDYLVDALGDVAVNCDVAGTNRRTVTVSAGDTAAVGFDVACLPAPLLAVVIAVSGNADVYTVKANGTGLTRLTTSTASDDAPAWSPDGSRIAFVSARDGNDEIYVMNADGSGQTRLTNAVGTDVHPAWSPDGSRIAFVSDRGGAGNLDIWVMNADGTNPVRLTSNSASDVDPAWSPDGTRIAFSSYREGNGEIYVMNADGSGARRLTFNTVDDVQPTWSPDGTKLAVSQLVYCDYYSGCDYDLVVINADASGEIRLPSGSSDVDPAWSPDGRWIAFGSMYCDYYNGCYGGGVTAVRADGSYRVEIAPDALHPAWRR